MLQIVAFNFMFYLSGQPSHEKKEAQSQQSIVQSGSGTSNESNVFDDSMITRLTDAISSKLEQRYPSLQHPPPFPNWQYYETIQPSTSSGVIAQNTTPQNNFGIPVEQNQLNDTFDCKQLLKVVPKLYKQKAKALLDIFEERPNDVTFDTKGIVYIDGVSLPNSSIKKLFPALFKKRQKNVTGLTDVVAKLEQMNLLHLINYSKPSIRTKSKLAGNGNGQSNWWYLK